MKRLFTVLAFAAFLSTGSWAAYANDNTTGDMGSTPDAHHHNSPFDKLPPQDAQLIHDTMQKAHDDSKPLMAQAKKIQQDLQKILTADQFDEKSFVAAQDKLEAIHDKIKAKTSAALASAFAQLSPEDRKIIAESMAKRHKWSHDKHGAHATQQDNKTPVAADQSQ